MGLRAVVTLSIGERSQRIAEITHPTLRAYADRIGADFVVIDEPLISSSSPHYEKFQLFSLLNTYERIIYLDADLVVRKDCPNLFEEVPPNRLGVFNEGAFTDRLDAMRNIVRDTGEEIEKWDGQYYNTGVMVVSRIHKFLFEHPVLEVSNFYEQSYLNLRIIRTKTKVHELEYKFNRMTCMDKLLGEHRLASYIVHYAGFPGETEDLIELIQKDLNSWEENPSHEYKRNIFIRVHGGLGDEVCAEPVVRYIAKEAYKDARIIVETWFPELFRHLNVETYYINTFEAEKDQCYYTMESMLSPETPAWKYMSANLMHCTDFCSLCCLRKILPDKDKQPILLPLDKDFDELREVWGDSPGPGTFVVVHPGKGWESKTFPDSFWNQVVAELHGRGHKVALIGKYLNSDQGMVDLDLPDGVLDLRNLLSLGGLMALLSRAKVLVSNDSGPVHIASAFDNHIVLVPSCKHPDHVFHIREGNRYHKAEAVYKRLTCDDISSVPTEVHGQTIDHIKQDWGAYLPEASDVADAVDKAWAAEKPKSPLRDSSGQEDSPRSGLEAP